MRPATRTAGTALLRTGPGERLTLTVYGRLFARDVAPPGITPQSRSQATRHTVTTITAPKCSTKPAYPIRVLLNYR